MAQGRSWVGRGLSRGTTVSLLFSALRYVGQIAGEFLRRYEGYYDSRVSFLTINGECTAIGRSGSMQYNLVAPWRPA